MAVTAMVLTSCGWRGIAAVPLDLGPGSQAGSETIYVQVADTLALNINSRVRVADVFVGTVRKIELKDWVPTLTLRVEPGVSLPANATAKIGQSSLLGTQHVELAAPPDPSSEPLRNGATIPLSRTSAFPTVERTLASVATVLRGGGIPNLEIIQNEVNDLLTGNADQIRAFLGKLDVFTAELNKQRDDIARAIESTGELFTYVSSRNTTIDRLLVDLPPLMNYLAGARDQVSDAVIALGRFGKVTGETLSASQANLRTNLELLQRPLVQLGRGAPYFLDALRLAITNPYPIDNVPKVIRGDYMNLSLTLDLTLSSIDNAVLTGTGVSGMLRALEQSWGRDPSTMIPDVRFTPHPNMTDGGPYVERGE
ncbi:MCE family protein [Mycolicibacterium sp.]|uniref:MCE family protein n=1 Tax=Mycolicibacterium sp. TaxID=2320850 RepID=UPI0025E5182C|nr:MCE family protein [Mycolicibacterium sp.]MCB9410506.1 MCE family protein [Mycolicibacterium sp.]